MKLQDKTIVITGASGGIGSAMAHQLAQQGARLVLAGRNQQKLVELAQRVETQAHWCASDLATPQGRQTLFDTCRDLGGADVLVNAAGISQFGQFEHMSEETLHQMVTLNLLSPMALTRLFLPLLKLRESAAVVNVGSAFGSIGYPGFTSYSAGKFGLRGFSEALQRELSGSRVRVMYLAPRATQTEANSVLVDKLNEQLGNQVDAPYKVAVALVALLQGDKNRLAIGWPEKLFARINGLWPEMVDKAIAKQQPKVKAFFNIKGA